MSGLAGRLVERCREIAARAPGCLNEQAVKQSLILPLLAALGYDVFDSTEVYPEHHADFSEKYQNKVDYAVMMNGAPVIAIEAKGPGAALRDDRGQLRSYFNAARTVKLGILTNGIRWECYADTDEPNMMDDAAFLVFDLAEIAKGSVDTPVLAGIEGLCKGVFDPENVGAEARRKLLHKEFVRVLAAWAAEPDDDLVRLLLNKARIGGKKTSRIVDDSRPLVKEAFTTVIDQMILARVGFADRPVVKIEAEALSTPAPAATVPAAVPEPSISDIETTAQEMAVYEYTIRRLAFMVKDEQTFAALADIKWQDMKTVFRVYYKRPVVGSLFTFRQAKDGAMVFEFPALDNKSINCTGLGEIDSMLYESFVKRVAGS